MNTVKISVDFKTISEIAEEIEKDTIQAISKGLKAFFGCAGLRWIEQRIMSFDILCIIQRRHFVSDWMIVDRTDKTVRQQDGIY